MKKGISKACLVAVAGLLLLLIPLVVGCAPKEVKPPTPQTPALTIPPDARIVVRYSRDVTGPTVSTQAAMSVPSDEYFRSLNEQGGIEFKYKGQNYKIKVDYVEADDKYDIALAVANYKKFVADKPQFVMFNRSGQPEALGAECARDKIPMLAYGIGDPEIIYNPGWVFCATEIYPEAVGAVANYIVANWKETRPIRIAYLIMDTPSGWGLYTDEVKAYFKKLGKIEVVRDPWFMKTGDIDLTTEMTAMKKYEPDFIISSPWAVAAWKMMLESGERAGLTISGGGKTAIIGINNIIQPSVGALGPVSKGAIGASPWKLWTENVPAWDQAQALATKYGRTGAPDIMNAVGLTYARLIHGAAKAALETNGWPITGAETYAALQSGVTGDTLGGLVGPIKLSATERRVITSVRLYRSTGQALESLGEWFITPTMKKGAY